MTTYLLRPLHWNPNGYDRPAGHRATDGYPRDFGYGHEEWNGTPEMRFMHEGTWHRAFYTNPVGDAAQDSAGSTMLFMYASHHGVQDLVGIAGRATDIRGAEFEELRSRIRRAVGMAGRWKDAWALPLVQSRFKGDLKKFREHWDANHLSGPTWICPETHALWLRAAVPIDAAAINGKTKLNTRFTAYTMISEQQAEALLRLIPPKTRDIAWNNLWADLARAPGAELQDIEAIKRTTGLSATTKDTLIKARLGQGRFRADLMRIWGSQCAVTGCQVSEALRASHIKPWKTSTNKERLDPANGLLLVANLDALFDRGLISFENDGKMVVSRVLPKAERRRLGLPQSLRKTLSTRQSEFLAVHREQFRNENGF